MDCQVNLVQSFKIKIQNPATFDEVIKNIHFQKELSKQLTSRKLKLEGDTPTTTAGEFDNVVENKHIDYAVQPESDSHSSEISPSQLMAAHTVKSNVFNFNVMPSKVSKCLLKNYN